MNIKKYLFKTLSDKRIIDLLPDKRIYFLHANNPNKKLYLEYEIINEYGIEYDENEEEYTTYLIQVDIFSTEDYTKVENIVKEVMKENDFERDMAVDLYEKDTRLYHKAMRFNISLPTSES